MAIIEKKPQKITSVGKDVEKLAALWECEMVQLLQKTVWRSLRKLSIELYIIQQFYFWVDTQKN